jgi:hypothetical protein
MQELVERSLIDGHIADKRAGGATRTRSVTVNMRESPLAWLKARSMIDARQFEAGERLRSDYERAQMAPSVTMRWDAAPAMKGARGPARDNDPTTAQVSAKRRFDAAIADLGPGLKDIAWRTICACEPLPMSEKAMGWPARSGRLVLTLALDRLADHYGLG